MSRHGQIPVAINTSQAQNWLAKFRALAPDITIARIKAEKADKDGTRMAAILDGLLLARLDEG